MQNITKKRKKWFLEALSNTSKEIQKYYYHFLQEIKNQMLFFDCFEVYASQMERVYPFKKLQESNPFQVSKPT